MKNQEYTLPIFAFVDGQSHKGNELEGRTLILHTPTMTLIECVFMDEILTSDFKGSQMDFEYLDMFGAVEHHKLIAFSRCRKKILEDAWGWYSQYLSWEDENIRDNERKK